MQRLFASGAALALLAACNSSPEEAPPAEPAAAEPSAASAPAAPEQAAASAVGGDVARLAPGAVVEATRATQCHETGANADEPPWDVATGSIAKVVAVEGDLIRVQLAGSECLIPADAVKPSTN